MPSNKDFFRNKLPSSEAGDFLRLTASGQLLAGPGALIGIMVASASGTPAIKVWHSPTAENAVLVNTFTPIGGQFYPIPAKVTLGAYISITGTIDCTVFYDSEDD